MKNNRKNLPEIFKGKIRMTQIKNPVTDIYWYDIIKNVLSESKTFLYTIEIWDKIKDNYGYSYDLNRLKMELMNLQRTGYAKSVLKHGKQAWEFPSGSELVKLERYKKIDFTIADLIGTIGRIPTLQELFNKMNNEGMNAEELEVRLNKIANLTKFIDNNVEKFCQQNPDMITMENTQTPVFQPECNLDSREISFYETIIEKLNGKIEDVEILTIMHIIDLRKKKFSPS